MKRFFSAFLIFTMLVLVLASCETGNGQITLPENTDTSATTAPAEGTTGPIEDGIDYIKPPKKISYELESPYVYDAPSGILLRFDIKRKRATIACPDPLCDHGDKCPVNGIADVAVAKDYIYFRKGMTDLYCYRLAENKVERIFRTNGRLDMNFYPVGNRMYFSSCEYEINKTNGSISRQIWNFYRYDAETNQTEKLSKEPIVSSIRVLNSKNGRLHLEENGKQYSTDMNFENRSEEWNVKSSENFTLSVDYAAEGMTLSKTDLSTGESKVIASGMVSMRGTYLGDSMNLDEGHLIYGWLYTEGELNEKGELIQLNRLYYIDKETFSSTLLWEGKEPLRISSIWQEGANTLSSGGYVGLRVQHLEDDMITNGLLIVNPMKNEAFVILCEQTRRKAAKVVDAE